MKRKLIVLLCLSISIMSFSACSGNKAEVSEDSNVISEEVQEETILEDEQPTEVEESQTEDSSDKEESKEESKEETAEFDLNSIDTFDLTSESINEGIWNSVITKTENGKNVSPQLSWEPVEGANGYLIYMIDTSAGNWMHWKSGIVEETNLDEGWASEDSYIGPYPPGGTHIYDIYVFAIKNAPQEIEGDFDCGNYFWDKIISNLDCIDGESGNILSYGYLSGSYTAGE